MQIFLFLFSFFLVFSIFFFSTFDEKYANQDGLFYYCLSVLLALLKYAKFPLEINDRRKMTLKMVLLLSMTANAI